MSSRKASTSASGFDLPVVGQPETSLSTRKILTVIDSLRMQVANDRTDYVKKRMKENNEKVLDITKSHYKLSMERRNFMSIGVDRSLDLLTKRQKDAIDMHNGVGTSTDYNGSSSSQEDGYTSSAVLLGLSISVKNAVCPVMLPKVKKIPTYTSWIFLDRNQRMTEDQSVVGRRRIYYDQSGGEALIASDSDEEAIEDEDSKKEFGESEDYVLRMTIKEVGLSDTTLHLLARSLSKKTSEIQARYECLIKSENVTCHEINGNSGGFVNPYIDKDLDDALDSFDNLFCRRCLVFDCRLHGCSQDLLFPTEKQSSWTYLDVVKDSCGPNCYRLVLDQEINTILSSKQEIREGKLAAACNVSALELKKCEPGPSAGKKSKFCHSESASSSEIELTNDVTSFIVSGKCGGDKRSSKRIAENILVSKKKRQRKMEASHSDSDSDSNSDSDSDSDSDQRSVSHQKNEYSSLSQKLKSVNSKKISRKGTQVLESDKSLLGEAASGASNVSERGQYLTGSTETSKKEFVGKNMCEQLIDNKCWQPLEKALCEKGIQIFGRNSCLIARNLMNGLKSCSEIFTYIQGSEKTMFSRSIEGAESADVNGGGARRRSRFLRRKGRVRRLKYTWKSAGYPSFRKRNSDEKDQPYRQYNPCGCQSVCGKDCSCHVNGTCCEKYCGCPKSCKNRFRGCHCAKSQCRSRQCPCFAADRECDPDVCRNCWISCGHDTILGPSQRGDNYECRNMKLLLRQQQRVLLGRSDISGWGAFLKNSVGKHEYLGEYTGELISHYEAEKRGKIYDRVNQSFLFNLNNQFVLDAYRKGDKLKFANHSPDPNCYAKVVMVNGDHRVGIFAKQRISAGEELFYDYLYAPDCSPAWAKKPEASGSKKTDNAPSSGRAKKNT